MKKFNWNEEKNRSLKKLRGVSFEEAVFHIENDFLIAAGYVLADMSFFIMKTLCSHRPCYSKPKTLAYDLTNQSVLHL